MTFVADIDIKLARDFMKRHHYLGDVPSSSTYVMGLTNSRGCVTAVAAYGPCQAARLPRSYLELKRLAADNPEPSLSSFLAKTLAVLKKRNVRAVLTWADPAAGHHGGIYQATNWVYAEPRSYSWNCRFITPSGDVVDHKKAFRLFGTSGKKRVLALNPTWRAELPPMKLRYLMPLNASQDVCIDELNAVQKPYPKPVLGLPGRPPQSQRKPRLTC